MNWQKPTRYSQLSEDGRYSVAKIGLGDHIVYDAYRARAHEDGPGLIQSCLKSADEARQLCEADDDE